jgi:hypothetical protein
MTEAKNGAESAKPGERSEGERRSSGLPETGRTSAQRSVRRRIGRAHKGDAGRPGTNEEVFQGSKEKELQSRASNGMPSGRIPGSLNVQ